MFYASYKCMLKISPDSAPSLNFWLCNLDSLCSWFSLNHQRHQSGGSPAIISMTHPRLYRTKGNKTSNSSLDSKHWNSFNPISLTQTIEELGKARIHYKVLIFLHKITYTSLKSKKKKLKFPPCHYFPSHRIAQEMWKELLC